MNMNERRQQRRNRNQDLESSRLVEPVDNPAFEDEEHSKTIPKTNSRDITESVLASRHRDKSMEVAQRIRDDKPNEVIEELHVVRDKIKGKIKNKLANELEKLREKKSIEEIENKSEENSMLKLDLSMSTTEKTKPSNLTGLSARESSRQRVRAMQEQTGEKASYRIKGQGRRDATRFDSEEAKTDDKVDDVKVEEDGKLKENAKKKFKKIGHQVLDEVHMPNKAEQFDFFTNDKIVRDDMDEEEEPSGKVSKTEADGEEKEPVTDKTTLLMEVDDFIETEYQKSKYRPHEEQKKAEREWLFMPSAKTIPLNLKLDKNQEKPRFLENEGYYVGKKPYMTIKNKNLMSDRLLRLADQRGLQWFDVDGEILAMSDPIKYTSTRPSSNPTYSPELSTEFIKAVYLKDFANNLLLTDKTSGKNMRAVGNAVSKYRIDLDISQVQFNFHHLFSAEHMLAFRLRNMFKHYLITHEQNLIEILTAKLKALKEAEARFKAELSIQSNQTAADRNLYVESTSTVIRTQLDQIGTDKLLAPADMNKLNAYRYEIKQVRQQRDNEMMLKKDLTEKILSTWKELKEIRTKRGFKNTELKLIIKKKEVNSEKELAALEKDLREELDEVLTEMTEEFQLESSLYQQKLKAYKFQQTKKTEARKRHERREAQEKPTNFNIKTAAEYKEQQDRDFKIMNEEDLVVPVKPVEIDRDKVLEDLRRHYVRVRKTTGDPHLFFELIEESGTVTQSSQCSATEQARRNKLAKTRMFVKIVFNGKPVFSTDVCQLQSDFSVKWGQIFNIFMISFPDSILLQLFEIYESKSHERMIAELNLPMPDANCSTANYTLEDYEFASPHAFYMHSEKSNQVEIKYTSGCLKAGCGWGISESDGSILVPTSLRRNPHAALKLDEMKSYDAIAALGVSRMQDIEKLTKWVVKSNLDPNDPRNADLINLIKSITEMDGITQTFDGLKLPEHFRLDQLMAEFGFSSEEEIENNKRNKLISLRWNDEPEFRGLKMLPNLEKFVKRDTFDVYEKRKQRENNLVEDEEEDESRMAGTSVSIKSSKDVKNEIELARIAGQKHVKKIRQLILSQFKFVQSQKKLADMVIEEQVPDINALGSIFYNLYVEPKRPLYPIRRERKKLTGQNLSSEEVRILVNVVNAYDLPIRKDKLSNDPMKIVKDPITGRSIKIHEYIAGESLVRPFVEVSFQDTVFRTSTADGPNASWNQEIYLPFKAPNNDLRPDSLQTCKDHIYFNIYDEVQMDALEDERDRGSVVHKRIMRFWLGCLKIPFSTVYFKSKIEGTFKLESPPLMIGYTRDPRLSKIKTSIEDATLNMEQPFREASYITLFITIEPQLLVPEMFRESYDSIENITLLDKVVDWSMAFNKKFPTREFRPTVMNTEGKSVIITRYFKALKPPEELINSESNDKTVMNLVRFVNLIPFVSDSLIFPGICDVWATCDEFLYILSGDEEEHSVLLVNFFLGIGKKAWLLIGASITNGICSYALTVENTDYTIWYQGQPYKVNEPHNPVKVVSAIVNAENMWLNIQSFDEPYRIKFDINDSRCWRPFFNKSNNNITLPSIQKDDLHFTKTDVRFVKELESKIETRLRDKLQEWRPRHLTKFNRYGCSALRQILNNMENLRNETVQTDPDELKQLEASYRISGFPLSLPYTNMTAIFEAVQATQVHAMPTSEVEYALAVHVHSYPNTIMAVWIYLAVLIRK